MFEGLSLNCPFEKDLSPTRLRSTPMTSFLLDYLLSPNKSTFWCTGIWDISVSILERGNNSIHNKKERNSIGVLCVHYLKAESRAGVRSVMNIVKVVLNSITISTYWPYGIWGMLNYDLSYPGLTELNLSHQEGDISRTKPVLLLFTFNKAETWWARR